MGYWDEVRHVLQKGVDLAKDGIKEEVEKISDATKEGAHVTKAKAKLFVKQRELQTALADLGDAFYDAYKENKDVYAEDSIKSRIETVNEIEAECKSLEAEIE